MCMTSPGPIACSFPSMQKRNEPAKTSQLLSWNGWICSGSAGPWAAWNVSMRRKALSVSCAVCKKTCAAGYAGSQSRCLMLPSMPSSPVNQDRYRTPHCAHFLTSVCSELFHPYCRSITGICQQTKKIRTYRRTRAERAERVAGRPHQPLDQP